MKHPLIKAIKKSGRFDKSIKIDFSFCDKGYKVICMFDFDFQLNSLDRMVVESLATKLGIKSSDFGWMEDNYSFFVEEVK